ncbi:probable 2-oxoglutarate-dependent dioxygenase AOP1 [Abrus precatorius]|uniref:Probable 2-oxoglutarate-dependent dioxygenase AOP1 n=1 Tax=Abrus precatorius TaxID=3816 RepID=A0A8B8MG85_ABRPR|nr:probable 2-oxoglutarate-dependent dioxygenase AOP1 [Abrus precatorius]
MAFPLPVVDFNDENLKPGSEAWHSACDVVRTALEDHGCYIARYQIDEELRNSVISAMDQVFELPLETRKQETSDKPFHSYLGQIPTVPLYESVGIEDPLTISGCKKFEHIMWPQGNDRFSESVIEYAKLLAEFERVTKRMVSESYGVDMKHCDSIIKSTNYLLRCFKYRAPQRDESNLAIDPHTDLSFTSVLHQLNNLNGLEIKLKNGEWYSVDASPSFIVVLAGDAFKCWSNGRIRACEHRVTMNAKKRRYCMGLSSYCSEMMQIPKELVDEKHPLGYKPFDHYGYLRFFEKEKIKEINLRLKAYCGV